MSDMEKKTYIGYEYKEITVSSEQASFYLDSYKNFGWKEDENFTVAQKSNWTTLRLKRDRKIINKMELTRLQRHFEVCLNEIDTLEKSKASTATAIVLTVGLIGTAFIAGSTFAVAHEPPIVWLCILLAIPGFTGWTLPCFLHKRIVIKRTRKLQPMIEAKYEEIHEICEKGYTLLY